MFFNKKDTHITEENENIALLCSKMHFDAKEAYKLLRTNVLFTLPDSTKCRVIGITSPIRGEGKSTVAINLAYTLAATEGKVLLIDMDMRLPSVAKKLEVKTNKGLSDYLVDAATKSEVICMVSQYENWDIIFSGSIPPTPAELIGSDKMKSFMEELRNEYDYIVVDLPPVNVVSDALVAKDITDGFVVVVREGYSDKRSLSDCMRQLDFLDANVLGFALSDSSGVSGSYGKKYSKYNKYYKKKKYGYYRNYGYYKDNKDSEDK